jgi:probable phosphoglycerate mutase
MTPSVVRLYLVRHAEALANPDLRYIGSRDDPLTDLGQWQAAQLAQAFAGFKLAAVYSSPLTRTLETARPLAQPHGLAPVVDARLAEGAMGTWEGLRRSEIIARSAEDAAHHQRWETDPTCGPPGGESFADVQSRVLACVHDLATHHAGVSVVVVSHVGPIKALLCAAMDVPLTAARRMFLDSATVSVIDWGTAAVDWGAPAVLRLYNAHHHLGWEGAQWMRQGPSEAR